MKLGVCIYRYFYKKRLNKSFLVSMLLLLAYSSPSQAQEFNKNQVYIGSKALTISYDESGVGDDEAAGFQIGYSRVFADYFEFRGSYYYLEHDDVSSIEIGGVDLEMVAGKFGLGFKIYGGGGLFSETWENSFSKDFAGFQLVGGIGYNWPRVGIDLTIEIRDASDYEKFVNSGLGTNVDAVAASADLNVGFRF